MLKLSPRELVIATSAALLGGFCALGIVALRSHTAHVAVPETTAKVRVNRLSTNEGAAKEGRWLGAFRGICSQDKAINMRSMIDLAKLVDSRPELVPVTRFLLQESLARGQGLPFESQLEQLGILEGLRNEYSSNLGLNHADAPAVGNLSDLGSATTFARLARSTGNLNPKAKELYKRLSQSLHPTDRLICDTILLGAAATREEREWAIRASDQQLRDCPPELKLSAAAVYELVSGRLVDSLR